MAAKEKEANFNWTLLERPWHYYRGHITITLLPCEDAWRPDQNLLRCNSLFSSAKELSFLTEHFGLCTKI
jgi:hypothetical protein